MTGMAMRSTTGQSMMPQDMVVQGGQGPRPTTLSGSAGETPAGGRRPVSVLLGFSAAMLVGVLAMVGIRALKKPPEVVAVTGGGGQVEAPLPPQVKPTPPTPPVAPAAQLVTVTVVSTPPGAEVNRDDVLDESGKPLVTPAKLQVKKGASLSLKLKLDGYGDETRSVVADKDQSLAVTLAKVEKVAPPPTRPEVKADVKPADKPTVAADAATEKPRRDKSKSGHRSRKDTKKTDDGLPPMF